MQRILKLQTEGRVGKREKASNRARAAQVMRSWAHLQPWGVQEAKERVNHKGTKKGSPKLTSRFLSGIPACPHTHFESPIAFISGPAWDFLEEVCGCVQGSLSAINRIAHHLKSWAEDLWWDSTTL